MSISVAANPRGVAVDVGIAFEGLGGAVKRLAPVSPYPVDQPMRTRLRLPPGQGRLIFTLIGAKGPLIVRIGPIGWLESEP